MMSSNGIPSVCLANKIAFLFAFSVYLFLMLYTVRRLYLWCLQGHNLRRHEQQSPAIGAPQLPSLDRPTTGLDPSIMALLPTFIYKMSEKINGIDTTECSICLSSLEEDIVRLLPNCLHLFHAQCIDMWLFSHSTCPICRTVVAPKAEVQTHGTGDEVPPLEPLNPITPISEGDESDEDALSSPSNSFHKIISCNRSEGRTQSFANGDSEIRIQICSGSVDPSPIS
ncbi:hypothetical protein NE237_023250 [Protea cynaroides]|uniref:RING-type E3 ubiquitin transferase n=1 Tax=Protea cynaroides TaxID=273540 RepID=A0A9Q0HDK7_9MAGN|nr:hypothetical protein NE237_023250 [Protea cynaroides]